MQTLDLIQHFWFIGISPQSNSLPTLRVTISLSHALIWCKRKHLSVMQRQRNALRNLRKLLHH
ncbi:hypothetical protein RchiOBHm_Chr6g0261691 [Rosa chinensis]|uniref:Uncharacterized protein n=1 Tax=Rosa chinensis TaxID=74649 RepID=A0A2P6PNF6_ROSCH|nr:hypothetical protein RchiOBHm_Chr6g0261691 [Rosa chinensis]